MIRIIDAANVDSTRETKEGYLVAHSRVARTGTQHYLADELGDVATKAGFKSGDVVSVYRSADEVFSPGTLRSITRMPVTIDHPSVEVTADNWSELAVGEVGDTYRIDGDWVVVQPMLKDSAAILKAKTTHKQISMGYTTNIIPARDGVDADFEMTDIRYNHLAAVPKARAGDEARIGDTWGIEAVRDFIKPGNAPITAKGGIMPDTLKTVILGDSVVQVSVTDAVALDKFKADSAKTLTDAQTAHTAMLADKDEQIGTLTAELKEAQDAAKIDVDKLVADRSELVAQVKAVDSKIETAGKSDADLRKAAVASRLGDEMVVDASDDAIKGMFAVVAKTTKTNPAGQAFSDGLSDAANSAINARDAYVQRIYNGGIAKKEA